MGHSGTLHWALNFWACDNLGEEDSNRGKITRKCPKIKKKKNPGVNERQKESQYRQNSVGGVEGERREVDEAQSMKGILSHGKEYEF